MGFDRERAMAAAVGGGTLNEALARMLDSGVPSATRQPATTQQLHQVVVPPGIEPGMTFQVQTFSGMVQVTCPQGVKEGEPITIDVPAMAATIASVPVQPAGDTGAVTPTAQPNQRSPAQVEMSGTRPAAGTNVSPNVHIDVPRTGAGQSWVEKQEEKENENEKEKRKKASGELNRFARSFGELPDCMMKLICMVTLLLSDADLAFTYISFVSYYEKGFMLPIYAVSLFTVLYIGGAYLGAREGLMLYQRFRRSVRRNDINNLRIKHLDMYMNGGYLTLDPKDRTVLDAYAKDELVVCCQMNFDVREMEDSTGGTAMGECDPSGSSPQPTQYITPDRRAAVLARRAKRPEDNISFFELQQKVVESLHQLETRNLLQEEYEGLVWRATTLRKVHQETTAAIVLGLRQEIVSELKRRARRYLKALQLRRMHRGRTSSHEPETTTQSGGAMHSPPLQRLGTCSSGLGVMSSRSSPGFEGRARCNRHAEEGLEQLPERLYLDEHYHPRKNLIALYTDDEREQIICEVFMGLKDTAVLVRVNETKKSIVIQLPFDEEHKGCKKKELAKSALELLTGFLPGQRVDEQVVAPGAARLADDDDGDDGTEPIHSRVFRSFHFTFTSSVMMLSTARKEKVKERSDFEMQQRYEERARALMPKNRMGSSSNSMGGNGYLH